MAWRWRSAPAAQLSADPLGGATMSKCHLWIPVSAEPEPLVVLAREHSGPWVDELVPEHVPAPPIQFYSVQRGTFGPLLKPQGLVLLRDDLVAAICAHVSQPLAFYPAVIREPQAEAARDDYVVMKAPRAVSMHDLMSRPSYPVVTISESEGYVAVSDELRQALEREGVHGLRFEEPRFAAA